MSYGGSGEDSAQLVPVDAASTIRMGSRAMIHVTAPGSLTAGRYGLFRLDMEAGAPGAKPHFHRTFSEAFYVLSGQVGLWTGTDWQAATAGDFCYVPEGGIHGFRGEGEAAASMLILFSPAPPRERFFEELAEIGSSGRQLTSEEWTEFYARHDQYMV